jgi:hypothetical protein
LARPKRVDIYKKMRHSIAAMKSYVGYEFTWAEWVESRDRYLMGSGFADKRE